MCEARRERSFPCILVWAYMYAAICVWVSEQLRCVQSVPNWKDIPKTPCITLNCLLDGLLTFIRHRSRSIFENYGNYLKSVFMSKKHDSLQTQFWLQILRGSAPYLLPERNTFKGYIVGNCRLYKGFSGYPLIRRHSVYVRLYCVCACVCVCVFHEAIERCRVCESVPYVLVLNACIAYKHTTVNAAHFSPLHCVVYKIVNCCSSCV